MAGNATDYLETKLLQHAVGIAAFPMPTQLYLALCTSASTDATRGTEVAGGGYVRMALPFAVVSGHADQAANAGTVEFPAATTNWGLVGWLELWDALTGGNRHWWLPLSDPADPTNTPITRDVRSGDIMRVPAGAILLAAD